MGCSSSKPASADEPQQYGSCDAPPPQTEPLQSAAPPPASKPVSSASATSAPTGPTTATAAAATLPPSNPATPPAEPALAYVIADFVATEGLSELAVQQGEFVELVDNQVEPPPTGWCYCRASTGKVGLVPWYFLVSSAHALLAADLVGAMPGIEQLEVTITRGEGGALGIDFDEDNCIRRLAPGSPAVAAGIQPGDLITGVDGTQLAGRSLMELLEPTKRSFVLMLTRGLFDPEQAGCRLHPLHNATWITCVTWVVHVTCVTRVTRVT